MLQLALKLLCLTPILMVKLLDICLVTILIDKSTFLFRYLIAKRLSKCKIVKLLALLSTEAVRLD